QPDGGEELAQERQREEAFERSVEQTRELMCKTRIWRRGALENGLLTAKSISIKSVNVNSGSCARKAVELTSGDLSFVVETRLRVERSICWIASSNKRCCKFYNAGGTRRSPSTATVSVRGAQLVRPYLRRSNISPTGMASL